MRTVGLVVVISVAGCSIYGPGAPSRPSEPIECSTGHGTTVADAVGATAFLGLATVALRAELTNEGGEFGGVGYLIAAPTGLLGVIYLAAAIYGYRKVAGCRAAHRQRAAQRR